MPPDFIVAATVTLSGTATANVNVTVRNERTNETTSATTNSAGKAVISCNNLTSGWQVGDIITAYAFYTQYEVSSSHTILSTEGGWNVTLALTAVSIGDLNYCTIQDVYDFLNIGSDSTDITAEQIRKIGLRVEDQIERRCNTLFHNNDDSYTTVTDEYHDMRNNRQTYFFLRKRPIYELTHFEVNQADEGTDPDWVDIAYKQLDACDAITGWSGSTDAGTSTVYTDLSDIKEGDGALNLIKSGTTVNNVTWTKTMTQIDSNDRELKLWYHIDDTDDLASSNAVEIRWGNDASNYFYKRYNRADLSDDWNGLKLDVESPTGETGNPDRAELDYFAIKVTYAASTTTKAAGTQMIDHIRVGAINDVKCDLETGRCVISDYTDSPDVGSRMVKVTYKYGWASTPEDIKQLTILMIVRELLKGAVGKSVLKGNEAINIDQLKTMDTEIENIFKRFSYHHLVNV